MKKIYLTLTLFFLTTINVTAQEFSIRTDNLSNALIDIAMQSEDMKAYTKQVVDEKFFNKFFIIKQNNSIFIRTPKFNKDINKFITDLFSSYCSALGANLYGGELLSNKTVKGDKVIYASPIKCFDNVNKKLLFKSVSDGSKIAIPTYIEIVSEPEYVRKNLIDATAKMQREFFTKYDDIGFYGKDNRNNYILYIRQKKELNFKYTNVKRQDPFVYNAKDLIGYMNHKRKAKFYPVFDIETISLKGDDCKMKDNNTLFIYPEGYCEITFHNVIFPNVRTVNLIDSKYKSTFGEFNLYPLTED